MVSPQRHIEAMDKINSLLNVRERNVKETEERLLKCGFTPEEVDDAIGAALRVDLINEERYARAFIRGKTHSGWGRLKIVQRLKACDIPNEIIESCESEFSSPQDEFAMALRELQKRRATSKDPYATYMRRLVNRGYSYELSKRVVAAHLSCQ